MDNEVIYREKLRSARTTGLFLLLALIFFSLGAWGWTQSGGTALTWILLAFSAFFLFYVVNFRTLEICLDRETFQARFGLIRWRVSLVNIASIQRDELPWFLRNGGAGVHFFLSGGLYRVNFNFLEHARLLILFKKKVGPVQALSLSTRQPEKLTAVIQQHIET